MIALLVISLLALYISVAGMVWVMFQYRKALQEIIRILEKLNKKPIA